MKRCTCFYVAWTRAEEGCTRLPDGNVTPATNASGLGSSLNVLLGALPLTEETFGQVRLLSSTRRTGSGQNDAGWQGCCRRAGTDRTGKHPGRTKQQCWRPMHWLPRLRNLRNPLEEFSFAKRRSAHSRTTVWLAACKRQRQLTWGTRKDAHKPNRACAFRSRSVTRNGRTRGIVEMLACLACPGREWLRYGTPNGKIVDESGELYRSRQPVDRRKTVTVVEYKTGSANSSARNQLNAICASFPRRRPGLSGRTGIPRSQTP